jgi:hypothetical protein
MTRKEKLGVTFARMEKQVDRPKPDSAILGWLAKRAEQALQIRYWSKLGHELPKERKIKSSC